MKIRLNWKEIISHYGKTMMGTVVSIPIIVLANKLIWDMNHGRELSPSEGKGNIKLAKKLVGAFAIFPEP